MKTKKNWQIALAQSITDVTTLAKLLKLELKDLPSALAAQKDFAVKVPKALLKKIKVADPQDPLLLQVLAQSVETKAVPGYEVDPLQEKIASPVPGMLHKYQSRILLITAGSCAVNCRYCFRRNFPYDEHQKGQKQWQLVLEYLHNHPEVNEVILSGGDPLLLPDAVLAKLCWQLSKIPHIKILRIHTRLPVFIPERLDQDFLAWFVNDRFKAVIVLHINHPNEIDAKLARKMQMLKKRGVTVYNQSVLLKGINDNADTLKTLSEKLFFECGIQPYYLHFLDKVKGAAHFAVSKEKALMIYDELLAQLPGYLVPTLVSEVPGKRSKTAMLKT